MAIPQTFPRSPIASRRHRRRFGLAALIAGIALILVGGPAVPHAWQASRGGGTPGAFVATANNCLGPLCYTEGEWTATDGSASYPDARLYRRVPVGESVNTVAFPGSRTDRIFEPRLTSTLFWVLWGLLGLALTLVGGVTYLRAITRR